MDRELVDLVFFKEVNGVGLFVVVIELAAPSPFIGFTSVDFSVGLEDFERGVSAGFEITFHRDKTII